MAVLVTGGAGYIGSHAVWALKDAGWPVAVIDNLVTGFRWAVPDDVPFYEGDVADSDLVAKIIKQQNIGAIMHFAGSVVVPESMDNPLKYYDNNSSKSRCLIESVVANGVKHFIFSSTAATYGIPEESPVSESTAQVPINPYGMSKLMTEYMLRDVSAAHDLNFCALRYFNVAGADPQGRTGESTIGSTHLVKIAAETAQTVVTQLIGVGAYAAFTIVCAVIIFGTVKAIVGLRVDPEEEIDGLDYGEHGNSGYHFTSSQTAGRHVPGGSTATTAEAAAKLASSES